VSHGVAELPPNRLELDSRTHARSHARTLARSHARTLETTLPVRRGARTVRLTTSDGKLRIETVAGGFVPQLAKTVAHMFRLDEDLSQFYELVREDELS